VRERRQRRLSNCTAGRAQLPPLPGRARERVAYAARGGCCSRGSSASERHTGRALWRTVLCHWLAPFPVLKIGAVSEAVTAAPHAYNLSIRPIATPQGTSRRRSCYQDVCIKVKL
jgi:hypothetical protein